MGDRSLGSSEIRNKFINQWQCYGISDTEKGGGITTPRAHRALEQNIGLFPGAKHFVMCFNQIMNMENNFGSYISANLLMFVCIRIEMSQNSYIKCKLVYTYKCAHTILIKTLGYKRQMEVQNKSSMSSFVNIKAFILFINMIITIKVDIIKCLALKVSCP